MNDETLGFVSKFGKEKYDVGPTPAPGSTSSGADSSVEGCSVSGMGGYSRGGVAGEFRDLTRNQQDLEHSRGTHENHFISPAGGSSQPCNPAPSFQPLPSKEYAAPIPSRSLSPVQPKVSHQLAEAGSKGSQVDIP